MATNPYPHKNGSHKGMRSNKEFLLKVSTPVLTNKYSAAIITINPKIRMNKSLGFLFIIRATKIMTI
jgi:hypothetical protein